MAGEVRGLEEIVSNLNKAVAGIEGATLAGLMEAGLQIEHSAKGRVPVDTGNLKNSGYTRKAGKLAVEVGFTAFYAVYVHENLDARHPVGEAKFLQNAVSANEGRILEIIQRRARVG